MSAKTAKRSFRAARRAEDEAAYPTSEDRTSRRAFLGRMGRIMAGGAAMALMVGCGSRPVDPEDRKPPQDPNDPYEDWPMGGVPDTMPAPLDAGPVQGDGEPEPPEHTGGAADVMPAPLDGGSGGDTKADS